MAQFRNISGDDRVLALPEWFDGRLVPAGSVVDVEDVLADRYSFDQPGVWETVTPSATIPTPSNTEGGN